MSWKKKSGSVQRGKQRFVGFAISSLIKNTRKQFTRSKEAPQKVDDDNELVGRLHLLKSMRVFEHNIINDEEDIRNFYCSFHRLLNDGYLTLIAPKYVGLGLSLLKVIADAMNIERGSGFSKRSERILEAILYGTLQ